MGDRSEKTCTLLWKRVPKAYKGAFAYNDFWDAYQRVLPPEQGKGESQTCHIERFNNTLWQRLPWFVRRTFTFCKSELMCKMSMRLFSHEYNQNC